MSNDYETGPMFLVYRDAAGNLHTQPWQDLTESGTLSDGVTDEDMEIVGWELG